MFLNVLRPGLTAIATERPSTQPHPVLQFGVGNNPAGTVNRGPGSHRRLTYEQASELPEYPLSMPRKTMDIPVRGGHTLRVKEYGNPKGKPVVWLHGGPGGGMHDMNTRMFDPQVYRLIMFDQRGAGQSKPYAGLSNNTTKDLIADMEVIRKKLGISNWVVGGHSWGSALSLAYAEKHPDKVTALVVGGVFTGSPDEIDWLYRGGASTVFPDLYETFLSTLDPADRTPDRVLPAYLAKMQSPDAEERRTAVKAWNTYESAICYSNPVLERSRWGRNNLALALIECFYAMKDYFFKPDELIQKADKLKDIPTWIVQGRHDWVCPFKTAWRLHQTLPQSRLIEVEESGHGDPTIFKALTKATDELKSTANRLDSAG